MTAPVDFDFEDVLPTVRAAAPGASIEEAEDAIQTAVVEHLRRDVPLTAANVVQRAKSRLIDARKRLDNRNASLDAFRESDEDTAGFEFAIEEVDYDSAARLAEARDNPVLARRLEAVQKGAAPRVAPRGANHQSGRYSDEVVAEARRLRDEKVTYAAIADRLGVNHEQTVRGWCLGQSRCVSTQPGWSRELAIEAILHFHREEGRRPVETDMRTDPRLPAWVTIRRLFGSWAAALEAAGYPIKRRRQARVAKWTRRELRKALDAFVEQHDRWPRFDEFRACNGLPSPTVVERLCGTTSIPKMRQALYGEG